MIVKVIKNEIKHQDIGGKEFIVDENITETLSPEEIFRQAYSGNFSILSVHHLILIKLFIMVIWAVYLIKALL